MKTNERSSSAGHLIYSVTIKSDEHAEQMAFQETKYFKAKTKEHYKIEAKHRAKTWIRVMMSPHPRVYLYAVTKCDCHICSKSKTNTENNELRIIEGMQPNLAKKEDIRP